MREGWEEKSLGDCAEVISGQSPKGINCNKEGKGTPFYQGKKEFQDRFIGNPTAWTTQVTRLAQSGDILMSVRAPVGPINFANRELCIGRGLAAIRPTENILADFLFYFLFYKRDEIEGKEGAVFASINRTQIKKIPIPVPPLPEQRRIVAILDEAFEGIAAAKANAEKNLENAREVFESRLSHLLFPKPGSTVKKTLTEIAEIFGRGKSRHRPRNAGFLYGGPYPFIQTGDIRNAEHIVDSFSQTYSEKGLAQSKLWPKGTVCITIAANIAESGILDFDACFPDSVIGVVVDPQQTTPEFLEFLLQAFKGRLQKLGKGSAQDNLNMGTFENQYFPFPDSIRNQEVQASEINTMKLNLNLLSKKLGGEITALDELKKSLLHQAFNGDL